MSTKSGTKPNRSPWTVLLRSRPSRCRPTMTNSAEPMKLIDFLHLGNCITSDSHAAWERAALLECSIWESLSMSPHMYRSYRDSSIFIIVQSSNRVHNGIDPNPRGTASLSALVRCRVGQLWLITDFPPLCLHFGEIQTYLLLLVDRAPCSAFFQFLPNS